MQHFKCPHCGKLGLNVEITQFDPEDIVTCSNCGLLSLLVDVLPEDVWLRPDESKVDSGGKKHHQPDAARHH